MTPATDVSTQSRAIAAAGVMVGVALCQPAIAQNRSWNAGAGNWATAANWFPASVPGPANVANIGDVSGVQNSTVSLNQNATVAELEISDGMRLLLNGNRMTVNGVTQIVGRNAVSNGPGQSDTIYTSWIRVDAAVGTAFRTDHLDLDGGGAFSLYDNALVDIDDSLSIGSNGHLSYIAGRGTIRLNGTGPTLINNGGLIHGGASPGLTLQQTNGGTFDLDGQSGDGAIELNGDSGSILRLIGTQLADNFSGTITLTRGSYLDMDLTNGWTADANSGFNVFGVYADQLPARLVGSDFTFAGTMQVTGEDASLNVAAETTITPEGYILVGNGDRATFGVDDANTTIEGGEFQIAPDGLLRFAGPTVVQGGEFRDTAGNDLALDVDFGGPTTWRGTVTIDGYAQQWGDATVNGVTTIEAEHFDMDGPFAATVWNISQPFALNVDSIDSPNAPMSFGGTLNIGGGLIGGMSINLSDPAASWTMAGTTNLSGDANLFPTRIGGSTMQVTGDINVTIGRVQITAPTVFAAAATLNLPTANSRLRINARSVVDSGTSFTGPGLLINGANGTMRLADGVATDQVGLQNNGDLLIADAGAGVATVNRFEQIAGGSWRVSLGGDAGGSEHDLMVVSGPAVLAGALEVELFNIGNGQFAPQVGDEFTILTAGGGVTGTFEANPISCAEEDQYNWTVIYEPNVVSLLLTSITAGHLGDMNCDCFVTVGDIGGFVMALTNPAGFDAAFPDCSIQNADVNQDGFVTVGDIGAFVNLLTQ
ncbi:MAG: hypothetical protein SF069_10615 [Phycisphaerae bacterium]|nr:hypothetical protein [Phycisphaerae bacterium]